MTDLLTGPEIARLRKQSTVLDRLLLALDETFPATPAADTNPCVDAVGGGTFEQGDAA